MYKEAKERQAMEEKQEEKKKQKQSNSQNEIKYVKCVKEHTCMYIE